MVHGISENEFLAAARNFKFGSTRANPLERDTCIIPLACRLAGRPSRQFPCARRCCGWHDLRTAKLWFHPQREKSTTLIKRARYMSKTWKLYNRKSPKMLVCSSNWRSKRQQQQLIRTQPGRERELSSAQHWIINNNLNGLLSTEREMPAAVWNGPSSSIKVLAGRPDYYSLMVHHPKLWLE
jgi:hypothetical protein